MNRTTTRALGALAAALVLMVTTIGISPATAQVSGQAIINSSGGTNSTDGLKIYFGGSQLQVFRDGSPQLYGADDLPEDGDDDMGNGIFMTVGTGGEAQTVYPNGWTAVTTGGSAESGSAAATLTAEVDGLTYTVKVTIDYVRPNQFFNVTLELTVPAGNTKPVRLYHQFDALLGGSDSGNQFFNASPLFAGVTSTTAPFNVEGVIGEGLNYFAGRYDCPTGGEGSCGQIPRGEDLTNTVDTTEGIDNGFAYQWPAVTAAGTYTNSAILTFSSCRPDEALTNCVARLANEAVSPTPTPEPEPTPSPESAPAEPVVVKPTFTG
jgi:hypothetical protein